MAERVFATTLVFRHSLDPTGPMRAPSRGPAFSDQTRPATHFPCCWTLPICHLGFVICHAFRLRFAHDMVCEFPSLLPRGVTVAQVTLDHFVMVRIHARQVVVDCLRREVLTPSNPKRKGTNKD
jgi:hypothetical protein